MALKTTTELLEDVESAIGKTLSGQSGTWDGKQLTMADLDSLWGIREKLKKDLKIESGQPTIKRNRGRIYRG